MITGHFPLSIGEEVARSERALLARMEDGEWMQSPFSVRFLVLHCSATRCNRSYTVEQMMRDHTQKVGSQAIQMATIVVTTIPILCVYPFVQKHFVKGVMIGAIKG